MNENKIVVILKNNTYVCARAVRKAPRDPYLELFDAQGGLEHVLPVRRIRHIFTPSLISKGDPYA